MELTSLDLKQIRKHGIKKEDIIQQLEDFNTGFIPSVLTAAATVGNGIKKFDSKQIAEYVKLYEDNKQNYSVTKFVPASGAATRMMKDLYEYLNNTDEQTAKDLDQFPFIKKTVINIKKFAFYNELANKMQQDNISINKCLNNKEYKTVIDYIVSDKGLGYGKYPKAWILFHKQDNRAITAFEQHLQEAAQYGTSNGVAKLHFTVLPSHLDGFERLKNFLVPLYEEKYNIKYDISFSFQSPSTDTVAVDTDNNIVYDNDGNMVFRPAGHGALIKNLNQLDSDIIFIKNIDNISSKYGEESVYYKEFLGGVLISAKQKINSLSIKLHQRKLTKQSLVGIAMTMQKQLQISDMQNHSQFPTLTSYKNYLLSLLDRPLRVCGMVKNTGEPGGGPFYVNKNGINSLQIVEKAQVNMLNPDQQKIFNASTHFNPVDLVISVKNDKGNKYNLLKYIDKQAGFIGEKSFEGKTIKAMERPGLWNGAMADWITLFVEVPISTFNPVKTLNDLLKKSHQ